MNRMHPEDLRAIIAAIQCLDPHFPQQVPAAYAVAWGDDLLAKLASNPKPDPQRQLVQNINLEHAKLEGANEERERILDLLHKSYFLRKAGQEREFYTRHEILGILAPKP